MNFRKVNRLRGSLKVPGDKSISHRAIMLGSLASGTTEIHHFLKSGDCLSTISCFQHMGIEITKNSSIVQVKGKGLRGLSQPDSILNAGNSGTTTRLLSGILCGQHFTSTLTGDASVQKRPMGRVIEPLSLMGANIQSTLGNGCVPLQITGKALKGIHYTSKVASAQVKSAILLAGLYGDGITKVTEPSLSRNHTEIMLRSFGCEVTSNDSTVSLTPGSPLEGQKVVVPGDISSAAFFLAAGLIVPDSEICLSNVGVNPTRAGILQVIEQMGGNISLLNQKSDNQEPTADILVKTSNLHGVTIEGSMIPTLIDEIPILAVLACFAQGTTVIKDASELKVRESNRIDTIVKNLTSMGAHITATEDGMVIEGGYPLTGTFIDSQKDHRIAMSFAVAALASKGTTNIPDSGCVSISYPGFYEDLGKLIESPSNPF